MYAKIAKSSRITALVLICLNPFTAHAQLEEITVTATRRIETLESVPVSVSAVSGESMQQEGIVDMADVSLFIPNFEVSDASILPNLYVRGIGSGTTHSIEQSVGRFIDDIYIGRAAINLHSFMDVSNVQVLRGPQGTLFGKNTLGGAVILQTNNPTDEFEAGLNLSYGAYSTTGSRSKVEGFLSGPLSETFGARLAFQYSDRDGYIENLLSGPDGGTREDWGVRAKFQWDFSDNTTVNLKLEHQEYQEDGQTPSETVSSNGDSSAGAAGLFQNVVPSFSFGRRWESYIDCTATFGPDNSTFCPDRDQDSQNITLKIDHDFSEIGTLSSITGLQDYEYVHNFVAIDQGIVGGALRATRAETFDGFSQEFRFTSEVYEKYDYILGVYYEDSELERLQPSDFNVNVFVGAPPPPSGNSAIDGGPPYFTEREDWVQNTETLAAFGQLRWNFSDTFSAVVGGRWATEDKDFRFELATVALQSNPNTVIDELFLEDRSETEFTPSLTLQWEATGDVMLYGTVSRGHKTGGFSDRLQDPLNFDAETNTNVELGLKGLWLDGTVSANVAVYHMSIEDLQVARALPGPSISFEVRNAAEATSQGVEFDGRWLINDAWTLGGNLAYTDATYDDFPGANASCPPVGGSIENGLCNYAGIPLIYAPEWKGAVYLDYSATDSVGGWSLDAQVSATFSSEYYPELNYIETLRQDSYSLWNANVRLTSPDERYTLALIGRNLTEEYVIAWGLQAGFTEYVAPNPPREISAQFTVRF
ncbi:MAG: TonB-dependent receptor [Pseudomonadota bacterium]